MAHILFADDNPYSTQVYTSTLRSEGHFVSETQSVTETISFLASNEVNLLVVDMSLTILAFDEIKKGGGEKSIEAVKNSFYNGLLIYKEARQKYPSLKIIVLSSDTKININSVFLIEYNIPSDWLCLRKGEYPKNIETIRNALK